MDEFVLRFADVHSGDTRAGPWLLTLMLIQRLLAALAAGETTGTDRLAMTLGCSRELVHKHVQALRAGGLPIQDVDKMAYSLHWPVQLLDKASICATLPAALMTRLGDLKLHWELDSTSSALQRCAGQAADLSMVLAETQSAGRGRHGRRWLSPPGLNLYLSCLKRFDVGCEALGGLSLAVAVMLVWALARQGVTGVGLKWPNDVLARSENQHVGGKLAGILVELSGGRQGPCVAVIGIGLNLRLTPALRAQAGQPVSDLAELCGGTPPERNHMATALIQALLEGLPQFASEGFPAFVAHYSRHDLLRDKSLTLSGAQGVWSGVGAGVNSHGALQVRTCAGLTCVGSAEVTVRWV